MNSSKIRQPRRKIQQYRARADAAVYSDYLMERGILPFEKWLIRANDPVVGCLKANHGLGRLSSLFKEIYSSVHIEGRTYEPRGVLAWLPKSAGWPDVG